MEGVATKSNKPMFLRSFLKDSDWSLASMSCWLVPSTSINISSDLRLIEKYKKVDVAIDAFSKELGRMQGS
eukprot:15111444-Ditylum_brightwellii.AAC.1